METFICFPGLRALCAQCHVNIEGVQKLFPPPFEEADLSEMARGFYSDNKRVSNERIKNELGVALAWPNYREGLKGLIS